MKEKCKKQQKKNKQRQKGARGTEAIAKGWELNDFVVHLSLELPLSITSKQR